MPRELMAKKVTKEPSNRSKPSDDETMGDRIGRYLKESGAKEADVARAAGVKQQTINYLVQKRAKASVYVVRIASALGVNPAWLQDGTGSPLDPTVAVGYGGSASPVRAFWVPKLDASELVQYLGTGEGATAHVVTSVEVGNKAWAMDVVGRSMAPDYREGDEIIVDPSVAPDPGDLVIALVEGVAMLRKYRPLPRVAGAELTFELVAVNPDFPTVVSSAQSCRLVGAVVEHRRRLR